MKRMSAIIMLVFIVLFGVFLRSHDLSTWPREGATFDEFAWVFQGLSLINTKVPTSWSPHQAYTQKVEYFNPQGAHFVLVTPYLEHPPLFGLIAGGYAYLQGLRSFDDVTVGKIRPFALMLGALSIILVYVLARLVYGEVVGLVSAGLYAVIPTIVAGSRLVQNENFFIPLFLLLLIAAERIVKGKRSIWTYVIVGLSFLLPLAKVPWAVAPAAVSVYLFLHKKPKLSLCVLTSMVASIAAYVVYGMTLDKDVFLKLMALQTSRYDMAFDSIFALFRDPLVTDRLYVDGWIYFGWFCLPLLFDKSKKINTVTLGVLAYLAAFLFFIPNEAGHGWYRYPFYPFLAIALALFIKNIWSKNIISSALFLLTTGLSMLAHVWTPFLGFSHAVLRVYLVSVGLGSLPVVFHHSRIEKVSRFIRYSLFILVICLTIAAALLYNEQ